MSLQIGKVGPNHYVTDPNCTDDHSDSAINGSIQWAIDQIDASGEGGVVELVVGTYEIATSSELTINGVNDLTIRGAGPATILSKTQSDGDTLMLDVDSSHDFCIRNLQVSGATGFAQSSETYVFDIRDSNRCLVRSIYAEDYLGSMLYLNTCPQSTLFDISIIGSGKLIYVDSCESMTFSAMHLTHNLTTTGWDNLLNITGSNYAKISGCHLLLDDGDGTYPIVYLSTSSNYATIQGNEIKGAAGRGNTTGYIYLDGSDGCIISANQIKNNDYDLTNGNGIFLTNTATGNVIKANRITDCNAYPVYIDDSGSSGNYILQNYFYNNGTDDVYEEPGSSNTIETL